MAKPRIDFDKIGNPDGSMRTIQNFTKRKQVDGALQACKRFLKEYKLILRLGTYTLDVNK